MTTFSEIFLDTNILVHSTLKDFDRQKYTECRVILDMLSKKDFSFYISTQIIREFYAVVTSERYLKKPLSPRKARDQILYFCSVFNVIEITREVIPGLLDLAKGYDIKGQKIHDTTIAATMLNYDIPYILSFNKKDFEKFKGIEVFEPPELLNGEGF